MKQINDQIFLYENSDIFWGFSDETQIIIKTDNSYYPHYVKIDPFPCYYNDLKLVETVSMVMNEWFPIKFKTKIAVLSNEFISRVNGEATKLSVYKDDKLEGFDPIVILSGKRIPIHPALTRYLVSHEFGHIIDYYITYLMNLEEKQEENLESFRNKYAKFRGVDNKEDYSSQNWVSNIGEIIANDCRIWAGIETEFWPHTVSYPDSRVFNYWSELKEKYSYKR